jgi:hypothetical protein
MHKRGVTLILLMLGVLLLLYFLFLSMDKSGGSTSNIEKYGKPFNLVRASVGIPAIEENWTVHESDSNYFFWSNSERTVTTTEPMHLHKTGKFINGKLAYEKDAFHYETKGDTAYRLLAEAYLDSNYQIDSLVFDLITYYKGQYPPTVSKYISRDKADSLLNQWGLQNLYQQ